MAKQVGIKVDPVNNTITLGRAFYKKAQVYNSLEYKTLSKAKADFPDADILIKEFKKNTAMERYKGLTYEYMREYIETHTKKGEREAALAEFDEKLLISRCHSNKYRYPVIKEWFLAKYPQTEFFGMTDEEIKQYKAKKAEKLKKAEEKYAKIKAMDAEESDSGEDAEQFNAAADF